MQIYLMVCEFQYEPDKDENEGLPKPYILFRFFIQKLLAFCENPYPIFDKNQDRKSVV